VTTNNKSGLNLEKKMLILVSVNNDQVAFSRSSRLQKNVAQNRRVTIVICNGQKTNTGGTKNAMPRTMNGGEAEGKEVLCS
jgi:hypothetical protein